ncbi:hypothetical protein [Paraburkholderia kururiensis]
MGDGGRIEIGENHSMRARALPSFVIVRHEKSMSQDSGKNRH